MATKSQASVKVLHQCGHEATRLVKSYNPYKKKYETVLDLEYLEGMDAPAVILNHAKEKLAKAVPQTVAYWSKQDCPKCWKLNLGTKSAA